MFNSNSSKASKGQIWGLALVILALQIGLGATLTYINLRTEDIPGRRIERVLAAEAPSESYEFLPDSAFSETQIPREECCATAPVIYRSFLREDEAAARDLAVLIVSAHDNALLYVDGALVSGLGRAGRPPAVTSRRPQLMRIPASLAHPGARIDIVVQRAVGFAHLRPFYIAEYDRLYPSYLMLRLLRSDVPYANAVIAAFVAFFCFCAAPLFGARALLFSLGALSLAWCGQYVGAMLTQAPWGANANNGVYFVSFLASLVCAFWFFVEWTSLFAQQRMQKTTVWSFFVDPWNGRDRRRLFIASATLIAGGGGIIAWRLSFDSMIGAQEVNRALLGIGLVVVALCAIRVGAFYLRNGLRYPIEASAFLFTLVAAVADMSMVRFMGSYGVFLDVAIVSFPLALLISLAVRARGVFEAATASAATLNSLVADREREIVRSHEEIRRNERAAMLLDERSRIMRDMHDGIGGQLLGIILQARARKLSDEALVAGLEQSLDDLRLVVDSLEQGEGSLTGALGAFRARIEPRCEAVGVELGWAIEDVGATPNIGPDKTLQIYRILLEACTNALKHGRPKRIDVSLRRQQDLIEIALADDGEGFDVSAPPAGRGLANMDTRARRIGAVLSIESNGAGARISLQLPALNSETVERGEARTP